METQHIQDNKRQIERIKIPRYFNLNRSKNIRQKPICGCDTETIHGKAFLIDIFDGERHYTHELKSFQQFIDYYFHTNFCNSINFFHNLQYDYQAILKFLSPYQLDFIAKHDISYYMITPKGEIKTFSNHNIPYDTDFIKGYQINIIPERYFKITPIDFKENQIRFTKKGNISLSKKSLKFYDLAQFYNFKSLEYLADKYKLNTKKVQIEDIANIDYKMFLNDKEYRKLLLKRIHSDTEITYYLAQKIYDNIWKIQPCNKFFSIASVSETLLKNYLVKHNIPQFVQQYFLWAYSGGRFECFKKGFFPHIWEVDINSAYPNYINQLVQIDNNGYWYSTKEKDLSAQYGVYYIKTHIDELLVSPVKYNLQKPLPFPNGDMYVWLDKNELDLLDSYGYDYHILKGVEYKTNEVLYPFRFIEDLYKQKSELKRVNPELYHTVKIIQNAIYGKFIQLKPITKVKKVPELCLHDADELIDAFNLNGIEMGVYNHTYMAGGCFNPVYASYITSRTRNQLFNDCKAFKKDLIGFQTDSIIVSKNPSGLPLSTNMGEYQIKQKDVEGVVIASGINQIGNQTKFRGFTTNIDLIEALQNCKNEGAFLTFDLKRFTSLKESYIQDNLDYDMLNVPRQIARILDVNNDSKRIWHDAFKTPKEVLDKIIDSKPLVVNT